MPTNECFPLYEDADRLTVQATAPVNGKRFITPSENFLSGPGIPVAPQVGASDPIDGGNIMVEHTLAGQIAMGVSTWDALTPGEKLGCITEGVVPVTAGANIAVAEPVTAGAEGKAVPVAGSGTTAVLETGVPAENNAILWRAVVPAAKPKIILKVTGANTPLSVSVAGEVVTVNVATSAGSAATSTAAQIIEAVNNSVTANKVVAAANAGASNGSGVVAAVAETALVSGVATTIPSGIAISGATSGNDVYVKLRC